MNTKSEPQPAPKKVLVGYRVKSDHWGYLRWRDGAAHEDFLSTEGLRSPCEFDNCKNPRPHDRPAPVSYAEAKKLLTHAPNFGRIVRVVRRPR